MANTRIYDVQYNVTANVSAAQRAISNLQTSVDRAMGKGGGMESLLKSFDTLSGHADRFKTLMTQGMNFKPTLDTAAFTKSLQKLEDVAKMTAGRINDMMASAMLGRGKSSAAVTKEMKQQAKLAKKIALRDAAQDRADKYHEKIKNAKAGSNAKSNYINAKENALNEVANYNQQIADLEKQIEETKKAVAAGKKGASGRTISRMLAPYSEFFSPSAISEGATALKEFGTAMQVYNRAAEKFNPKKSIAPRIDGSGIKVTEQNIKGLQAVSDALAKMSMIPKTGLPAITITVNTKLAEDALAAFKAKLTGEEAIPALVLQLNTQSASLKLTNFSKKVGETKLPAIKLVLDTTAATEQLAALLEKIKVAGATMPVTLTSSASGQKSEGGQTNIIAGTGSTNSAGSTGSGSNQTGSNLKTGGSTQTKGKTKEQKEAEREAKQRAKERAANDRAYAKHEASYQGYREGIRVSQTIMAAQENVQRLSGLSTMYNELLGLNQYGPGTPQGEAYRAHQEEMKALQDEKDKTLRSMRKVEQEKAHAERQAGIIQAFKDDDKNKQAQARKDEQARKQQAKQRAVSDKAWANWKAQLDADNQERRAALREQDQAVRSRQHAAREVGHNNVWQEHFAAQDIKEQNKAIKAYNEKWSRIHRAGNRSYLSDSQRAARLKIAYSSGMPEIIIPENAAQAPRTPMPVATRGGSRRGTGRAYIPMATPSRMTATPDLYTRSRKFWYPFTGNTSFGARTPMAVDMAKGMGAMFAIGGAMSAIGSSFSQAVEYQNIMRTTNAILENGGTEYSKSAFKGMEANVRDVGKKTKFTAPQVADAARFLAMAGYDIKGINSAIRPVADVAIIGDTDLGATADKLTNVMTAFGIDPGKMRDVADIMTTTFTRSNVDMMMLAESAKYAAPIAHMYGKNSSNTFADTMAMFGILGNAGIQASLGGTTIRMMYQNLMKPNKTQLATMKHYGIYSRDANHQPLELSDIIFQIAKKVPEKELADAVGSMFRITSQPGASALATHIPDLVKLMKANREAAGTGIAEKISLEKQNTIQGLWYQVTSTFTEAIVQAFEQREGGWSGMLANLRDYLAKPETVQVLSTVVDLVESLGRWMGKFASIWAKAYSLAPVLFKTWMVTQLIFTQLGYLATPIVQVIGVLNSLQSALLGTAAAGSVSKLAGVGFRSTPGMAQAAFMAGAGGMTNRKAAFNSIRGTAGWKANAAMAAASVAPAKLTGRAAAYEANAATMLLLKQKQDAYQRTYDIANRGVSREIIKTAETRGSMVAMSTRNMENAKAYMANPAIPLAYGVMPAGSIATNPKIRQHIDKRIKLNKTWGNPTGPVPVPFGFTSPAVGGRSVDRMIARKDHQKELLDQAKKERFAAIQSMRRDEKLGNSALTMEYYRRAQRNRTVAKDTEAYFAGRNNVKRINALREARHAFQVQDVAVARAYDSKLAMAMNGTTDAALLASLRKKREMVAPTIERANERRAAAVAAMRANRSSEVYYRYARMNKGGWGKMAGQAFNTGLSMNMLAGFGATLKQMMFNIMRGLSQAIGMLVSPVGLAVTAIAALGFAAWKFYENEKKKREEATKNAKNAAEAANQQRNKMQKGLNDEWEKTIGGSGLLTSNGGQLTPLAAPKKTEMDNLRSAYSDAMSSAEGALSARDVTQVWAKSVSNGRNMRLALGEDVYNDLVNGKGVTDNDIGMPTNPFSTTGAILQAKQQSEVLARINANNRATQAVMAAGGGQQAVMDAQIKIKNLREQLIAKKITQDKYNQQVEVIKNSVANTQQPGLLDATKYTAEQIQNTGDWSKFIQFQQGALNVLEAEAQALPGTMSGYLQGVQTLKTGVTAYSENWITAINQVIGAYRYPITVAGETLYFALRLLPNGQIDTSYIIKQAQDLADKIKLNISTLADMANQITAIMLNATGGKGNYYKTWADNARKAIAGRPVTAEEAAQYWDMYIGGKGYKSWGKYNREEYIKGVSNNKAGDGFGKERELIRDTIAKSQGYAGKRNWDKTHNADGTLKTDNTTLNGSGTNSGTNTPSRTPPGKDTKNKQKDYQSKYDRSSARPTQVIINIDKLCNFDRTAIASNADEQAVIKAVEDNVMQAINMLTSQALTEAGSLISQGLS